MNISSTLLCAILLLICQVGWSFRRLAHQRNPEVTNLPPDPGSNCSIFWDSKERAYIFFGPSCNDLPKNYSIEGNKLYIKLTSLTRLDKYAFGNYTQLTELTLCMNPQLHFIIPGAFDGLVNLYSLEIIENMQLRYLDLDVFTGLTNLKKLRLVKNGFMNFYTISMAVRPAILPQLESLDVSENSLGSINYTDVNQLNGTSLTFLKLSHCGLDGIDSNAFSMIPNLTALHIDNNNLKTETVQRLIENIANSSSKFTEVHIGSNYFSDPNIILNTISATNISIVDISNSHIFTLNPLFLTPSPSIIFLDFSSTVASNFEDTYFTADKLPNLEFLYLAHNRLLDRNFNMNLPKLKVLDLSDNCNAIGCTSILETEHCLLNGSVNLEMLRLKSNPIHTVSVNLFKGLFKLKVLDLSNASIQHIEIGSFLDLHDLEELDLSNNILSRDSEINNETFRGLDSLRFLHLDRIGLTCLTDYNTFQYAPKIEVLTLRQNLFLELHHALLTPLKELNFLDLSSNSFQSWNVRIFEGNPKLKTVDLSFNQISSFTSPMIKDLGNLDDLYLNDNSLSCVCADVTNLLSHLNETVGKNSKDPLLSALISSSLFCSYPESIRFTPYLQYLSDVRSKGSCITYNETMLLLKISILAVGLFIIITVPTIYFLRWHIKYWLFLLRQALSCYIFPKKKHFETEGKYTYDAFVSYSNEDRGFVVRLVSMLESHSPHFRLCVYERDFNVGGVITDNVVDCLSKSRRTILVLSDSFAKSTWCQWEMNLAQHKRLFFKDDHHGPLIIIKIGEIMEKHMTPTLRYLIKTRIYLQWNSDPIKQKVFWEKLRNALKAPLNEEDGRPSLQQSVIDKDEANNNSIADVKMSLKCAADVPCAV